LRDFDVTNNNIKQFIDVYVEIKLTKHIHVILGI
jgi:hypothetical protein